MDEITRRLSEMLDSDTQDAESTGDPTRRPARPAQPIGRMSDVLTGTGRGPTGRLRNFKAMSDSKLQGAYNLIMYENDDPEAIEAVKAEATRRGW